MSKNQFGSWKKNILKWCQKGLEKVAWQPFFHYNFARLTLPSSKMDKSSWQFEATKKGNAFREPKLKLPDSFLTVTLSVARSVESEMDTLGEL